MQSKHLSSVKVVSVIFLLLGLGVTYAVIQAIFLSNQIIQSFSLNAGEDFVANLEFAKAFLIFSALWITSSAILVLGNVIKSRRLIWIMFLIDIVLIFAVNMVWVNYYVLPIYDFAGKL